MELVERWNDETMVLVRENGMLHQSHETLHFLLPVVEPINLRENERSVCALQ